MRQQAMPARNKGMPGMPIPAPNYMAGGCMASLNTGAGARRAVRFSCNRRWVRCAPAQARPAQP